MAMCTFPGCGRQAAQASKAGRCSMHIGADADAAPRWSSTKARQEAAAAAQADRGTAAPAAPIDVPAARRVEQPPPIADQAAVAADGIEWAEPPPSARGGIRGWPATFADALMAKPGKWAIYTHAAATSGAPSSVVKHIRAAAGLRGEGRSVRNEDGTWTIYVRAVQA